MWRKIYKLPNVQAEDDRNCVNLPNIETIHISSAGSRCGQPRQDIEQCRLPSAIVPQHRRDLTLVDGQVYVVYSLDFRTAAMAERFLEADDSDRFFVLELSVI